MKRFAVLEFYQETNSFNPNVMTWEDFEACSIAWGPAMLDVASGDSGLAGMRAALDGDAGGRIQPVYLGSMIGLCGGRVCSDVISRFWDRIIGELRKAGPPVDGALMLLHGACASESLDDVEGWMIRSLRDEIGAVPISVGLDHHANVTREIVINADIVVGYQTEPHFPYETGYNATELLLRTLDQGLQPSMAWRKIPMISPMEQFETASGPMKDLFDLARGAETRRGVLSVSPFPMQPWLDVAQGGWSVVVVGDGSVDPSSIADQVAGEAWGMRALFWKNNGVPVEAALSSSTSNEGLVVLHDTGDSVFAGSTGDSIALLEALLEESTNTGVISIVSPGAVSRAHDAGDGNVIDVTLGGDPVHGAVLDVRATVEGLASGPVSFESFYGLNSVDEGRTALLRIGCHLVNVTEKAVFGGNDPALYERYGVELGSVRYAAVKISADYDRFRRWRVDKIRVNTPGCSQSDLASLPWDRLPRPIYGLDEGVEWRP